MFNKRKFLSVVAGVTLLIGSSSYAQEDLPPGISPKGKATNYKEHVARINATDKFLKAYSKLKDDHPVIHLNFLQWRPRGNGERYDLYGTVAGKEIAALGGSITHASLALTDTSAIFPFSEEWDEVAFAVYPRKRAYLALQQDEDYQLAIPDRVAGTYRRLLYALADGDPIYEATESIQDYHENKTVTQVEKGNIIVSELLRFKKDGGRDAYIKFAKAFEPMLKEAGGHVSLSLTAEFPIVSDEYWDHFVAMVFPSRDVMEALLTSDAFHEINVDRINGLVGQLAIAAVPVIPGDE